MAPGSLVEHAREIVECGTGDAPMPQVGVDRVSREIVEHDLGDLWLMAQVRQQSAEHVPMQQRLDWPVGGEDEQPGRITAARHVSEPAERRNIAPVKSSSTSTSGSTAASTSRASVSSRSIRSGRTGDVDGDRAANDGRCASQLGACSRRTRTTDSPRSRPSLPSASRIGMYTSPPPYWSTHCPRQIRTSLADATAATNASTSAVFPIPASPAMKPILRVPFGRPRTTRRGAATPPDARRCPVAPGS